MARTALTSSAAPLVSLASLLVELAVVTSELVSRRLLREGTDSGRRPVREQSFVDVEQRLLIINE